MQLSWTKGKAEKIYKPIQICNNHFVLKKTVLYSSYILRCCYFITLNIWRCKNFATMKLILQLSWVKTRRNISGIALRFGTSCLYQPWRWYRKDIPKWHNSNHLTRDKTDLYLQNNYIENLTKHFSWCGQTAGFNVRRLLYARCRVHTNRDKKACDFNYNKTHLYF